METFLILLIAFFFAIALALAAQLMRAYEKLRRLRRRIKKMEGKGEE